MCCSPAPAPACRRPGLVTVPALRAGVATSPGPAPPALGTPGVGRAGAPCPQPRTARAAFCCWGRSCAQLYGPPMPGRGGGCAPWEQGCLPSHCPQRCHLGLGTCHPLPASWGAVPLDMGPQGRPRPPPPAASRTITSLAPASSGHPPQGVRNEPSSPGPAWPPSHPARGAGTAPLAWPLVPRRPPRRHRLHFGSAC